jgi:hypothetical protein
MFQFESLAVGDGERTGDANASVQLVTASRGEPPLPPSLTTDEPRRVLATPDRFTMRASRDPALHARYANVTGPANPAITDTSDARALDNGPDSGPTNHHHPQSS